MPSAHPLDSSYLSDAASVDDCWNRLFDMLHQQGFLLVGASGLDEHRLSIAWNPAEALSNAIALEGKAFPPKKNSHVPWIFIIRDNTSGKTRTASMERLSALVEAAASKIDLLVNTSNSTSLTPREKQCLHLASLGHTRKVIANSLEVSVPSVDFHLKNAKNKLNARTITHAVALAMQSNSIHTRVSRGE